MSLQALSTDAPKNKVGRPEGSGKLQVSDADMMRQLEACGKMQCTQPEAAAILGVSLATFENFLGSNKKARDVWDAAQSVGRASVRRQQFKLMNDGNATMAIWLGKQYLGQKDKNETELTGKDGGPIQYSGIEINGVKSAYGGRSGPAET